METFENVLKQYNPLILHYSRKLSKLDSLQEELQQEGKIGLLKAYNTFTESKGYFPAYAKRVVTNQMFAYLQKHSNTIRVNGYATKTLGIKLTTHTTDNDMVFNYINNIPDIEYKEENELSEYTTELMAKLSKLEKSIVQMKLGFKTNKEMTFKEIAKEYNKSNDWARKQYLKAIDKIKEYKKNITIND